MALVINSFGFNDMKVYLHQLGSDPRLLYLLMQEQCLSSRTSFAVPHYVQVLLLKGSGHLVDETTREQFELRPGSLIQRKPGRRLTQRLDSADTQQIFFVSPPQMYDFIVASQGDKPSCIQLPDADALRRKWIDFAIEWREKSYAQTLQALPPLLAAGLQDDDPKKNWIRQSHDLLADTHLPLEQVANQLGMSYVSFRTRFRKSEQISPGAFRRQHLIARAHHLLQETDLPIGEIAELLSYPDIFSFSRQFKRECTISPQQWRHQNGGTTTRTPRLKKEQTVEVS